ncbi:hypothetical protein PTSG_06238 [Salpingoeca rosetta]|uniref:Cycloeucalenol cycloisomerase n=1 Tax=Salpingoeca rosetta (strain ATCC 50818 / BSB-021) TaxID=946362 RepID=F2UCC1_SALR5|nr:uncharacterized protein PTSG_06238 [Salpingoeca rosetta]EGD74228.1 hypothetical protein PTSG_06238 [Salpingoeca rosetta]|eukprot:XP_004993128.1 hypothetical protein PTSG_06238 [Salpingoeca rosetta]
MARAATAWTPVNNPGKAFGERVFLLYAPVWITAVACVVIFGFYAQFSARDYFLFGVACGLPAWILPAIFQPKHDRTLPLTERYWFKANVWCAVFSFIGHHFLTHYFYNVLGAHYTIPRGYEINGVPMVMYFLTHVYFLLYHSLATMLLRKIDFWSPRRSLLWRGLVVFAMAYTTAILEAWSISAFPHYVYPDAFVMYAYGSAFYAMMFLVTFPAFSTLDETKPQPLSYYVTHALACGMMVRCKC